MAKGEPIRTNVVAMSIGNTITTSVNSLWIMFMPYYFTDLLSAFIDIEAMRNFIVGIIFTGALAARAIASMGGGRIADQKGRKPTIVGGVGVYATGPLVILFSLMLSVNDPFLGLAVAIFGYVWMLTGSGFQSPASSMLLVESSPEKRKGLSYMVSTRVLPSIPPALVILVGAFLYSTGLFWLALIAGFVGLMLVVLLYAYSLRETLLVGPLTSEDNTLPPRRLVDGVLIAIIAAFALDSLSSSGLSWYVPLFVGRAEVGLYGMMISVSTLVIALSALGAGALIDKVGTRVAMIFGWLPLALTVAVFPHVVNPLGIIALYSVWAGLDMVDLSVPPLVIAERYPEDLRAQAMGLFSGSISLLATIGPLLISFALLLGEVVPFYVKAILNLVGLVVFLYATRSKRTD
ncbi:MAG: MFS transporter [Candidatus Thorarchaeota archaeon]